MEISQVCWQELPWVRLTSFLHGTCLSSHFFSLAFRLLLWRRVIPLKLPSYWIGLLSPGCSPCAWAAELKDPGIEVHICSVTFFLVYTSSHHERLSWFFWLLTYILFCHVSRMDASWPSNAQWNIWESPPLLKALMEMLAEPYWAPGHITSIQEPLWWLHATIH